MANEHKWWITLPLFLNMHTQPHHKECSSYCLFYYKPQKSTLWNAYVFYNLLYLSIHMMHLRLFPAISSSKALLMSWKPTSCVMNSSRWSSCDRKGAAWYQMIKQTWRHKLEPGDLKQTLLRYRFISIGMSVFALIHPNNEPMMVFPCKIS